MIINVNGKKVGVVRVDIFYKTVLGSKHFLKKPPAIAFDIQSIDIAEEYGATKIAVLDMETNVIYSTTMWDLRDKGFEINRGHGRQIALLLSKWKTECRVCDETKGRSKK